MLLNDRYELLDPIGRGGMAAIYPGRDIRTNRVVAIKLLREVYSTDPKFVARFQREAKVLAASDTSATTTKAQRLRSATRMATTLKAHYKRNRDRLSTRLKS